MTASLRWLARLQCAALLAVLGSTAWAAEASRKAARPPAPRYAQLVQLINAHRTFSAHFTSAVDARTVKEVRDRITDKDIPVLVSMMKDTDYGVASAASALLATLGAKAVKPLMQARRDEALAEQAGSALRTIENCYSEDLWNTMNPDVCPKDRELNRGKTLDDLVR